MTDEELEKLSDLLDDFGIFNDADVYQEIIDFVNAMLAEREKK